MPDMRSRTMTGVYHRFVGQYIELRLDTVHQYFVVATRQIGTAYTTQEQYVAADYPLTRFIIKDNTARRVAWCKAYRYFILAQLQGFMFIDKEIHDRGSAEVKPEHHSRAAGIGQHGLIQLVHPERDTIFLFHGIDTQHMIDMRMRIDDLLWFKLVIGDEAEHGLFFIYAVHTRIDDPAFIVIINQQVSIFLEGVKSERFYTKHEILF